MLLVFDEKDGDSGWPVDGGNEKAGVCGGSYEGGNTRRKLLLKFKIYKGGGFGQFNPC